MGLSLIFISHDLSVIKNICNRILVLKDGQMVETTTTQNLFSSSEQAYTRGLINSKPPLNVRLRRLPTVLDFCKANRFLHFMMTHKLFTPQK